MNEYSESYEKEISLVELLFYCLRRWRGIVCTMVFVGVFVGGYKYLATVKSNQIQQRQQELFEKAGGTVSDEVIKNPRLRYYEQAISTTEERLERQETYLRDSIVMQMDAYHLQVGVLSFYLDVAEEEEEISLNNLIAAYEVYVKDGRLGNQLKELRNDIPAEDLQYLISFYNGEKNTATFITDRENKREFEAEVAIAKSEKNIFQIRVIAPNEEICTVYLEKVKDAIEDYETELQIEVAKHSLKLLDVVQVEKEDEDIREYQSEILSSYASLLSSLKILKEDMEDVREEEGEMLAIGQTFVQENPVFAAIKYAVVGLVMGAFLAVFIIFLFYIAANRLQGTGNFEERFGMKLLGRINVPDKRKKWFGFLDRLIYQLEDGGYAQIPFEEQVKIVVENVKVEISKMDNIKKIMFTGTVSSKEVENLEKQIAKAIKEIEISSYQQIIFSAEALEELGRTDAVLFLEKREMSVVKNIIQEKKLAEERNVKILGAVVL